MTTFSSAYEAKQFLIDQIVQEAQRENVSLSATEQKMLYFSETASTLPDMEQVNKDFDRDCDQDEYEQKIAALIWNLKTQLKKENPEGLKVWNAAVRRLRKEDHYLLVLIDAGGSAPASDTSGSPWWSYALGAGGFLLIAILSMHSCH